MKNTPRDSSGPPSIDHGREVPGEQEDADRERECIQWLSKLQGLAPIGYYMNRSRFMVRD